MIYLHYSTQIKYCLQIAPHSQCQKSRHSCQFDYIEIFNDTGRPIGCLIYGDDVENFEINNITYKNIKYSGELKPKFTSNGKSNSINVTIDNVMANGKKLTNRDIEADQYATVTFR